MNDSRSAPRRWVWLGLVLTLATAGLLLLAEDREPPLPVELAATAALDVSEPTPAEIAHSRSELFITERGERVLRALDGPGIQGWLAAEGGERPRWLTARGEGLTIGERVAVAEDGRFAIADAIAGKRYLLMLPEGFVTSDAPSDDSVVGSRYVHIVAPARVDVYAQTLASTLRLQIVLPDDMGPASSMRALCALDGREARVFPIETDAQGWMFVPLPSDGWWTNLMVDPRLHDDVLYDPVFASRVDVPSSGVLGSLRLKRSRVVPILFLGPTDLPIANVRAEYPVTCAPSDADGRLRVRAREADGAEWTHKDMVRSVAFWPDPRDGPERIVRMAPRGSWRLVAAQSHAGEELELRRIPGAFGPGKGQFRRGPTLRKSLENDFASWELDNSEIGLDDALEVAWRGIPIRLEPIGFARGEGEIWPIAAPNLTRFVVDVLRPDGSPAAGATVRCNKEGLGRADEAGVLAFDLPEVLEEQTLTFEGGSGTVPIMFDFDARSMPAVPRALQFERAVGILLEISASRGELPRVIEVATEGQQGTISARLRQRNGTAFGGSFPTGTRSFLIGADGFDPVQLWHDVVSGQPLQVKLEPTDEE